MSAIDDLHELCGAVKNAVTAMQNFSAAASQAEGEAACSDNPKAALDRAKAAWRRYDQEANALTSFAAIVAARNPQSNGSKQDHEAGSK